MRPVSAGRIASAFGATALAVLLTAAPAAAQTEDPAQEAPATWGVNPSGQDGPDGRAAFDLALDPGETVIDFVGVSNFSTEPITLRLYASDAYTTDTGAFDLLPADQEPVDVGSWIGFNEQTLTVPSETRLDVPFALTVPADATPGDHVGGIVAAVTEATDANGTEMLVERRVGARVHLRVSGELDPNLAPDMEHVTYHYDWNPVRPGTTSFDYAVENAGNVRLQGELVARIAGPWGLLPREVVIAELPQILPGDRFEGTAEMDGVWPLARLEVELVVRPEAVDEADAASRLASHSDIETLWAPPWPQAAVVAALASVIWLLIKIRKLKRRNASGPNSAPVPESVGAIGETEAAVTDSDADDEPRPTDDTAKERAEA
ncbi:WxL protein peptidoglycan domain-containing protein [Glycomyces rhizosphaerae]|uniref:WxL protein peptidoglycan domain-containing protein n=1 Tax=Glycomyces rhizosphaerae TaxID=2054422 RepID=A0ABV7Q522_9ACTN